MRSSARRFIGSSVTSRGFSLPARPPGSARQVEADAQVAQLSRGHGGRGNSHEVLGAMVHREQDHVAQVVHFAQGHHDAVVSEVGQGTAVTVRLPRDGV